MIKILKHPPPRAAPSLQNNVNNLRNQRWDLRLWLALKAGLKFRGKERSGRMGETSLAMDEMRRSKSKPEKPRMLERTVKTNSSRRVMIKWLVRAW